MHEHEGEGCTLGGVYVGKGLLPVHLKGHCTQNTHMDFIMSTVKASLVRYIFEFLQ